jgi:hypothetical protein
MYIATQSLAPSKRKKEDGGRKRNWTADIRQLAQNVKDGRT